MTDETELRPKISDLTIFQKKNMKNLTKRKCVVLSLCVTLP